MEPNPSQNEQLYRAAVGEKKAGYYVPLFYRFDQGSSRASWNWPSFFVTFFWLLYRRMYGLAVGYLFGLPIALGIVLLVLVLIFGAVAGGLLYWVGAVAINFVIIPIFANAIYHWHVKRRIAALAADAPSQDALLQRVIGQAATAGLPVIVGVACLYGVLLIGVLAAIAIPAYQDYTIRSQVAEGLNLAASIKTSVAQTYAASSSWPADLQSAGVDAAPDGQFVSGIEVSDGAILIHYGNAANAKISGRTVSLHPVEGADGVAWQCGYSAGDDAQTDVEPRYLPTSCRGSVPPRVIQQ
ncbi:MAG TPA: pilin [Steroidobacteraceae bacterium]|jgi:Tfp pilus assembly major pilin PilA|nr:pilin [Steroidobacteraceae bacterium]